ncbi:MAG: iron ABC transporter permease [Synergistaceae bacterium]|nr:iron ABC transporter permease [Synergistaceae bacterium]
MSLWTSIIFLILISLWRITSGEWDINLPEVFYLLINGGESYKALVIRAVRLPRLLCSIGTGGLLSVSGVILQGLLANPLSEPYTLGIASGAAFGASIGILAGNFFIMPCALGGALISLALTGIIALKSGNNAIILAGVISNAILSAGVTFLKSISGDKLGSIVLWLMGSFSGAGFNDVRAIFFGVVLVIVPAFILAPLVDAMSLGQDRAAVVGVNENFVRIILLLTTSAGTALAVSSFGVIGFVGLAVPHIARKLAGAAHRKLIIHAFFVGACLMTLADGLAQKLGELPAGVITALSGGPFFCWLLARK